jgi:hypothetical protein
LPSTGSIVSRAALKVRPLLHGFFVPILLLGFLWHDSETCLVEEEKDRVGADRFQSSCLKTYDPKGQAMM